MVCVFSFIFIFTALPSGVAIAAVVIVFNAVSKYSFVEQKNSPNYVSSHAFVMSMSPLIGCLTSCCGSFAARRVRRLGLSPVFFLKKKNAYLLCVCVVVRRNLK
ncbi:GTP-binding nuclear protein Ran [Trichinella spiralis]|uniref:GTP-binding nuclear protein Ran n=1 Tax=Trichinella spiralis TaxID=6334 RepID=A0ABR3K511_TRISP